MSMRKDYQIDCGCRVDRKSEHLLSLCHACTARWVELHARALQDLLRLRAQSEGAKT